MRFFYKTLLAAAAAGCFLTWTVPLAAAPCFARQFMTPYEFQRHQATMWRLPPAARQAYRARHHQEMARRAAGAGWMLPQQPPPFGMGRAHGPRVWGPVYAPPYRPGWYPYRGWGRPGWGRVPARRW